MVVLKKSANVGLAAFLIVFTAIVKLLFVIQLLYSMLITKDNLIQNDTHVPRPV